MLKTPKSLRLQIGLFGRVNVGKSTFLNYVSSQEVSITSPHPGTTTDVVEKTMELLPVGPVVFLDTAGLDDVSVLSKLRLKKTRKIFERSDIFVLLTEPGIWGEYEKRIKEESLARNIPLIVVINKIDVKKLDEAFVKQVNSYSQHIIICSSLDKGGRDEVIYQFKQHLIEVCPADFVNPPAIIGDLVPAGGSAVLIVPIDLEAPKGRIILPQVQAIRDLLDNDAAALVVKEREYKPLLDNLKRPPDIVVCDSQVVMKMAADTPPAVKCTTFSILFSRYKGDLTEAVKAVAAIDNLKPRDRVLIAEACSHHPIEDDIGRVKIPRWLRQYVGGDLKIDTYAGRDYPDNLKEYKLIIHCGGCMIGRREMLSRINRAKESGVPITNYGLCISFLHGVIERVLSPFPAALDILKRQKQVKKAGEAYADESD